MIYKESIYKGNDIDNKNILNNYFNPYGYNLESILKEKNINNKVRSESHLNRGKRA